MFPAKLRFEEWAEAGPKISRIVDSFAWCLGDWLVYGQEKYEGRYATVIEQVGLDYQTLRNYAWVARKFPMSRRRERLSFQHHAEVASLPPADQDKWLDLAVERAWSRNQLRAHVSKSRDRGPKSRPSEVSHPLARIQVETDRFRTWRRAADQSRAELESWILASLDQAAALALAAEPGDTETHLPDEI